MLKVLLVFPRDTQSLVLTLKNMFLKVGNSLKQTEGNRENKKSSFAIQMLPRPISYKPQQKTFLSVGVARVTSLPTKLNVKRKRRH